MRIWLADLRKAKGFSQYKVAELAGVSQSYYASIETGARGKPLSVNTAKKIAETLEFDWTMFYENEKKATAHSKTAQR